jgi:hypothetical protein
MNGMQNRPAGSVPRAPTPKRQSDLPRQYNEYGGRKLKTSVKVYNYHMAKSELDGRVSRVGKIEDRYWYRFRQDGQEYGVLYECFGLGPKPVNFNYEVALQKEAAALAHSTKRSRRFKLPAYVETIEPDGEIVKVKLLLRGPLNQSIELRFRPDGMPAADVGFAVVAVMEKLESNKEKDAR